MKRRIEADTTAVEAPSLTLLGQDANPHGGGGVDSKLTRKAQAGKGDEG